MRHAVFVLLFAASAAFGQDRFGPNEGEVLAVYKEEKEIAIRHGYLPELGMDPMSMVFVVADPLLLERVKKGDRVRFKAGLIGGRFGIIEISTIKSRRRQAP